MSDIIVPDEDSIWSLERYMNELEKRDLVLEHYLSTYGDWTVSRAILNYVVKFFPGEGWPPLEGRIKDNPMLAVEYARDVLNRRFPEAEKEISRDPWAAHMYAMDVVKSRWPEGERAISCRAITSYYYAVDVICGRFPEGEKVISESAVWSFQYAQRVIKGRFPEGEEAIARSDWHARWYRIFLKRIGCE